MALVIFTKALTAANAANIAASQTPGGAGALTLVSSPVTLDTQRRVLITSGANLSGITFTIIGTRDTGQTVTEVLTGPNAGTAQSIYDYRTVTSIVSSGAAGGALTVGTSTVGSSDWKNINTRVPAFSLSLNAFTAGSVTYSIETTNSRFLATSLFPTLSINPQSTSITSATTNATLTASAMFRGWRLTILSGTGAVTVEAEQSGI